MEPINNDGDRRPNPKIVALNKANRDRNIKIAERVRAIMQDEGLRIKALAKYDFELAPLAHIDCPQQRLAILKSIPSFSSMVLDLEPEHELRVLRLKTQKLTTGQSQRAKHERVCLGDVQIPLREVVRRLMRNPERRDDTAKQLWPHFVSEFRELESDARIFDDGRDSKQWRIEFEYLPRTLSRSATSSQEPKRRSVSFLRFRKLMAEIRKEVVTPDNG